MGRTGEPLSPLYRWYIYAIHGYLCEVLFTALCAFLAHRDWRFQGVSSVWALFIYGTCSLALERLYVWLGAACGLLTRGVLYTLCIYLWEFSTGFVLRHFGACPWDYSHFPYNFMGLVTLEYCLFWFFGSLLLEKVVISNALRLRLDATWKAPKVRPGPSAKRKQN